MRGSNYIKNVVKSMVDNNIIYAEEFDMYCDFLSLEFKFGSSLERVDESYFNNVILQDTVSI